MMNKLEVGMYVRTNTGVAKVKNISDYREPILKYTFESGGQLYNYQFCDDNRILKTSHNLIDLIEAGDYVNEHRVLRTCEECDLYPKTLKVELNASGDTRDIFDENIKEILTKEQYEAMVFRVEE